MRPVAGASERESGSFLGCVLWRLGSRFRCGKCFAVARCRSKQVLIDGSPRVFDAGPVGPRKQGSS